MGCQNCSGSKRSSTTECKCDGPGYCPIYGSHMDRLAQLNCKHHASWRANYLNFFKPSQTDEAKAVRYQKAIDYAKEHLSDEQALEVMAKFKEEGFDVYNINSDSAGFGDILANILAKVGVSEEIIEKWSGIKGCGCDKRQKFLNRIFSLRKKE